MATHKAVEAFTFLLLVISHCGEACEWDENEELRRFVRVREDAPPGHIILTLNVTHPHLLTLQPMSQGLSGLFRVETDVFGDPGGGGGGEGWRSTVVGDGEGDAEGQTEGGGTGRVVVGGPLQPLLQNTSPITKFSLTCGSNQVAIQVTVYVEDVNDHAPVFAADNITVTVDELTPLGLTILPEIRVSDRDKANTANSEVELELRSGNSGGHFTMADRKKGAITLASTLDYDSGDHIFLLEVLAKDMGKPSLSSTTTVTVVVVDADDLPPVFSYSHYSATITEHPGPDTGLPVKEEVMVSPGPIKALDGDVGQNTSLRYTLVDSPAAHLFSVDAVTGQLYLTKHLDRENLTDHLMTLHIRAEQIDNPRRVGSSVVEVLVEDVNDNLPQFTKDVYAISIVENLPAGFSVVQVSAYDPDEGLNGAFNYHVVGGNGALTVNPLSGWLTVANHNILDREESPVISLHICANQLAPLVKSSINSSLLQLSTATRANENRSLKLQRISDTNEEDESVTDFSDVITTDVPETTEPPKTEVIQVPRMRKVSSTRVTVPLLRRLTEPTRRPVAPHAAALAMQRAATLVTQQQQQELDGIEKQRLSSDGQLIDANTKISDTQIQQNSRTFHEFPRRPSLRSYNTNNSEDSTVLPNRLSEAIVTSTRTPLEIEGAEIELRRLRPLSRKEVIHRRLITSDRPHHQRQKRSRRIIAIRRARSKQNQADSSAASNAMAEKSVQDLGISSCAKIELKLLDANDNNPVFVPSNQYQFSLMEDAQIGHVIGSVLAEDIDEDGNGQVTYKIQARRNSSKDSLRSSISINEVTGTLTLTSKLPLGQLTLFVEASDTPSNPSETRTSLAVVSINVKATHSLEPRFVGAPYELWVGGDAPVGTSIGQVRVIDVPGPELMFDMFHTYHEGVPFAIEETSGIISVVSPVQQYSRPSYDFEAVVTDGKVSLATNLTVHVATTQRPTTRRDTILNFSIQENLAGGQVGDMVSALRHVGVRVAPDPQFELVSPEARRYFGLDQNGLLYTVTPLDYETHPNHTLVIVSARTSDIFYVHVKVEDVNDNPPQLNAVTYEGTILEDSQPGTHVTLQPTIQVVEADKYPGSSYTLHLIGDFSDLFSIDSTTKSIIFVGEALDREMINSYDIILEARDDGNLTSRANLSITVEDVNDNPPRFIERDALFSARDSTEENSSRKLPDHSNLEYLADLERSLIRIPESLPIGSRVTQVRATDEDEKVYADIRYAIEGQTSFSFAGGENAQPAEQEKVKFTIEPKTGNVAVAGILKPDHFYLLNVSATDGGGLSSITTVSIAVFDVNDHTPRFERPVYNFEVLEGEYLVGEVGKVAAYDQDLGKNGKVHYQVIFYKNSSEDQIFPFRIVETSGTILATGSVNREEREVYEFSVVATDMGDPQLSSSVLVHIDVIDVNDHSPVFYYYDNLSPKLVSDEDFPTSYGNFTPVYTSEVAENTPKGTVIVKVFANDSDSSTSGNGIILYKLEGGEDKFAIDSKNGTIYTVGFLDYEELPRHNLTIVAQDLGSPPLTTTALLVVTVKDVEEQPTTRLFDREEYQVLVSENNNTPLFLLDLNVSKSYAHRNLHYQLADPNMSAIVAVDASSGEVYLITSLDRETKDQYHIKIQAVPPKRGRSLGDNDPYAHGLEELEYIVAPSPNHSNDPPSSSSSFSWHNESDIERNLSSTVQENARSILRDPSEIVSVSELSEAGRFSEGNRQSTDAEGNGILSAQASNISSATLGLDEVWLTLNVKDQNDNSPKFLPHGRPIVAAVPASADYGHFVTRIKAHDPDLGASGEVRYEILPSEGAEDATNKFSVDPVSGQVVVVGSLKEEANSVFGFDVRATDQRGAPTGRTAIANVFVYVLGSGGHLVMEVAASPRDVEPHLHHIQGSLTNVSGLDVRVQRIAPHVDGDAADTTATDVYVYAVDPVTQAVVKATDLRQALRGRRGQLRMLLPSGLHLRGMRLLPSSRQGQVLQMAELAILVGAVVVFLVTVTAIVCLCYKQRKRRRKPMPLPPLMATGGMPVMPLAYPSPFTAPYVHMSEHSSADSSEAQEAAHDPLHYHHEHTHFPQETTVHYPSDIIHCPHPPSRRRRSCAHNYDPDQELSHACSTERVSSHTDEDDVTPICLRHAPRKRRRGPQSTSNSLHGKAVHNSSRIKAGSRDEHSSSDIDERDHLPPQIVIPRPQRCCIEERPRISSDNPRGLPAVDCNLTNAARPNSPDSLERPSQSHQHSHSQPHTHTIPRTRLKRERQSELSSQNGHNSSKLPNDVTEL